MSPSSVLAVEMFQDCFRGLRGRTRGLGAGWGCSMDIGDPQEFMHHVSIVNNYGMEPLDAVAAGRLVLPQTQRERIIPRVLQANSVRTPDSRRSIATTNSRSTRGFR